MSVVVCVTALVTDRDPLDPSARVLLIEHRERGVEMPGGKVRQGEDFLAAVRREVREETGLVITHVGHLKNIPGAPRPLAALASTVSIWEARATGEPVAGDDARRAFWASRQDVRELHRHGVLSDLDSRPVLLAWAEVLESTAETPRAWPGDVLRRMAVEIVTSRARPALITTAEIAGGDDRTQIATHELRQHGREVTAAEAWIDKNSGREVRRFEVTLELPQLVHLAMNTTAAERAAIDSRADWRGVDDSGSRPAPLTEEVEAAIKRVCETQGALVEPKLAQINPSRAAFQGAVLALLAALAKMRETPRPAPLTEGGPLAVAALRKIADLAERCSEGDCDDNFVDGRGAHRVATHVTSLWGVPVHLCDVHAPIRAESHRKAESKGSGKQPAVEPFEQSEAVQIALRTLAACEGQSKT